MSNNTKEETPEIPEGVLFKIAKSQLYETLKWVWLKPIIIFLLFEGGTVLFFIIVGIIAKYTGTSIQIPLPIIDIGVPSLDYERVSITIFQSTITVSGIIMGFFAVSFFFMLNWSDQLSEKYVTQCGLESNQKIKSDLRKRQIDIEGATAGLCQYAHLVTENVIPLIVFMVIFFFYSVFSGIFIILNIILDVNAVLAISSAMYPLVRFIFVVREMEAEKPIKQK